VRLRGHRHEPTHLWIHPVGGGVDCYRALANALPFDAAALEQVSVSDTKGDPETVEATAAHYLQILEREQEPSPFVLAGWSFGGLVAYEMAVQLRRQGYSVPLVALIDSYILSGMGGLTRSASSPTSRVDASSAAAAASHRLVQQLLSASTRQGPGADAQARWDELPAQDIERLHSISCSNLVAAQRYRPPRYEQPVLLLRASEHVGDPDVAWRGVAPNLVLEHIQGDHYSIMRPPSAGEIAKAIQRRLSTLYSDHSPERAS
jgi:thioesterase domain-containing protein